MRTLLAALIACTIVVSQPSDVPHDRDGEPPATVYAAPVINPSNVLPGAWFTPTGARD